jgi:hypothetical protein
VTNPKIDPYAARTYDAPPQTWAKVRAGRKLRVFRRAAVRSFPSWTSRVRISSPALNGTLTGIVSVLFSLALRPLSASESVEAFDDLIDYGTGALLRLIAASKNLKLGLTLRHEARERRIISKCETFR